ncbi:hypothetical protein SESBI_02904 [Sesbania bispinosa]|nr:hypothetical protein SESBI_02904 [Sesbania bispinosa]
MDRARSAAVSGGRVLVSNDIEGPAVENLILRRNRYLENSPGSIADHLVKSQEAAPWWNLEELGTPEEIGVIRRALSISLG